MEIPKEVVIWSFGGKNGNVKSQNRYTANSGYNLYCSANKEYLTYGKEPMGINIVWAGSGTDKKIHFVLPDKKEREIHTGELVAFGLGGGDAFLYYSHRSLGINLKWSNAPVFEWKIVAADGRKGVPVSEGGTYALVNVKVSPDPDFFIYLDRVPGQADIGWTTSPNWPGKILGNISKYKSAAAFVAALI
jgi:hypothetical protein